MSLRLPGATAQIATPRFPSERIASFLSSRGYKPSATAPCQRAAARLSEWLTRLRSRPQLLDAPLLEAFNRRERRAGRALLPAAFVRFLKAEGLLQVLPPRPLPPVLVGFRQWMSTHRGVLDSSLDCYCSSLRGLVDALGEDPRQSSPVTIQRLVLDSATTSRSSRVQHVVSSVRMFLRYLACLGLVPETLRDAVPTVATWRLGALPRGLPACDLRRLVRSCCTRTAVGRRDRAVLLLCSRLALRAGDIAALRLPEIDWRAGCLAVSGKGRTAALLPLPQEVGDAILDYLEQGRPIVLGEDHVFLRALAPLGPLTSGAVTNLVERALRRAGGAPPAPGARLRRPPAATQMLRQGYPLRSIANLLRHRSLETTAIYAKVDQSALRSVAQPWPQVQP